MDSNIIAACIITLSNIGLYLHQVYLARKIKVTHDLVNGGLGKLIAEKDKLRISDVAAARAQGELKGAADAKATAVQEQAEAIVAADAAKKE